MAKSSSKKTSPKPDAKSPAGFASTSESSKPSKDNPSKHKPTEDAMEIQSLDESDGLLKLFTDAVKDIYWAEQALVKALPKMAKAAASAELSDAILSHLEETKVHVERLEQSFEILNTKPQARKCEAMEGLMKEGEAVIEDTDMGTPARDTGIIMASQKVEHYEIASYTGLISLASKLGLHDIADIFSETLEEEQNSDDTLAEIADNLEVEGMEEDDGDEKEK